MYLANHLYQLFLEGGPIMYPITLVLLLAVVVSCQRLLWWTGFSLRRKPRQVENFLLRVEQGDLSSAKAIAKQSSDPVLQTLVNALDQKKNQFEAAVQLEASKHMFLASKGITLLDTFITLGPLLGLLGTVTGIMGTFVSMGGDELVIDRVTGGIGEALIATAFGLGIAIITLIPYNWIQARVQKLQLDMETAANRLQLAMEEFWGNTKDEA